MCRENICKLEAYYHITKAKIVAVKVMIFKGIPKRYQYVFLISKMQISHKDLKKKKINLTNSLLITSKYEPLPMIT